MVAPVGTSGKPNVVGALFEAFVAADSKTSEEQAKAIAGLAAEQAKISERVTALLGRVSALETARTADKALLEGRIQGVDTKHTAEEQRLQVVLNRVLAANKALEDRLAASDAVVAELRRRVDGLEGRITHVGGEVHRVERDLRRPTSPTPSGYHRW